MPARWLWHLLFDPLSAWEEFKITLLLAPVIVLFFVLWYLLVQWLQQRKERKHGLGN